MRRFLIGLALLVLTSHEARAQRYDVKADFGGDIAAALSAAKVVPGVVYLTRGTYDVPANSLVVDVPGITLAGDGVDSTFLRINGDGDGILFGSTPPAASIVGCGGIDGMTISGINRTSGRTIAVTRCRDGRLSNLKITSPGHGIVFYCPTEAPAPCSRWWISQIWIRNTGASAGIIIQGGNDRSFTDIHIRGDRSVGSRGVLFKQSRGADDFKFADVILQEVGWAFVPDAGASIEFSHFWSSYGDSSSTYGWNFAGAGEIRGIVCTDCWAGGNGISTPEFTGGAGVAARGFRIMNGRGFVFNSAQAWDNGGIGIEIGPAIQNIQLNGGWASANGISSIGTLPGVSFAGDGLVMTNFGSGTFIYGAPVQSCGIDILASAGAFIIKNNDLRGNLSAGICNAAGTSSTKIVADNLN